MTQPFDIIVTDLDHLHDAPVRSVTWRVAPPKDLSLVVHVRADADGPFVPLRGRWARVAFVDPFFARLSAVGHIAHGEEFDGGGTNLDAADVRQLAQSAADGYNVPPVRFRFALTSGTEGVVVCERIEVEALDDPPDGV